MRLNEISGEIIGAALRVHRALGPGLLESAYEACLAYELVNRGLQVERQVAMPLVYEGVELDVGYRIDLVVQSSVLVEVKAVQALASVHEAQLLSYLKLSNKRLGLLINFHVPLLKHGIRRLVNNF
jgi:GxxExxY protein